MFLIDKFGLTHYHKKTYGFILHGEFRGLVLFKHGEWHANIRLPVRDGVLDKNRDHARLIGSLITRGCTVVEFETLVEAVAWFSGM